jgi:hypothetical protein
MSAWAHRCLFNRLIAAHNVCHRDLKSANVLFDKQLRIKLCDFAFSKFKPADEDSANLRTQVGTAAWMAPEVLRGDDYSVKCDVYSFGVILWEMIERRQPFRELNHFQLLSFVGIEGNTLAMPADAAPLWRATAAACWAGSPRQRPSFEELEGVFRAASVQVAAGCALVPVAAAAAVDDALGAEPQATEDVRGEACCAGMAAWAKVAGGLNRTGVARAEGYLSGHDARRKQNR